MATYKSAFSGAQMEDTFDKVQNKKITAADIGVQTYYNSLDKISSSLNTDSTPFEVASAMANWSMLTLITSGSASYTGGLIPQAENGVLVIVKTVIDRVYFQFFGEVTGYYDSFMRTVAGNFKGWRRHYTSANKPTAVDVGALSSSGGTMTGDLSIKKDTPALYFSTSVADRYGMIRKQGSSTSDNGFSIRDYASASNSLELVLYAASSDAKSKLRLVYGGTAHTVYGSHNITASTTAPTSALADGVQVQVYDA